MICVLLLVAAGALINLFNLAIHFPGFEVISRTEELASVFLGFLILYGVSWLLRFLGRSPPSGSVGILSVFSENNPLIGLTLY